jgi:hypothetical protein
MARPRDRLRLRLGRRGASESPTGEQVGEVDALVRAVRDDRLPLRPAFADELGSRVAAGFPRRRPSFGERSRAVFGWRSRTALGVATAIAVVVVVSFAFPGSGSAPGTASSGPAAPAAPSANAPSVAGAASAPTAPSAGGAGSAPAAPSAAGAVSAPTAQGVRGPAASQPVQGAASPGLPSGAASTGARAVESDASLDLLAPEGRVQQVSDAVIGATDRLGGIVASSNVAVDDRGGSVATLSLEVPSGQLGAELTALSSLAHVSSRTQSTLDITDATGAARDRLAASRDERDALLRQLGRASTPNEVASIDAQLGLVGGRIAADTKDLDALVDRGRFASLAVTITEPPTVSAGAGGRSPWTPGGAVDDALRVLEAAFALVLIGLAGFVPAGGLAALAWWAGRGLRRRRRQAALAA